GASMGADICQGAPSLTSVATDFNDAITFGLKGFGALSRATTVARSRLDEQPVTKKPNSNTDHRTINFLSIAAGCDQSANCGLIQPICSLLTIAALPRLNVGPLVAIQRAIATVSNCRMRRAAPCAAQQPNNLVSILAWSFQASGVNRLEADNRIHRADCRLNHRPAVVLPRDFSLAKLYHIWR